MYRDNESGLHFLELEVTTRCPLRCRHCYVDRASESDLPATRLAELVEEAGALEVNRLVFTGGEPMLCEQVEPLAHRAKALGIPEVTLLTTGLLVTERNVRSLSVFDVVQLSLDFSDPAERLRAEYRQRLRKTIRLLQRHDIRPYFYATLHKGSYPHLDEMVSFAQSLGVHLGFNKLVAVGNDPYLQQQRMSRDQYRDALRRVVAMREAGCNVNWGDTMLFLYDQTKMARMTSSAHGGIVGGCIAGVAALYITARGQAYPCPFVPLSCGDVLSKSLRSIWEGSEILNRLRDRRNFDGRCGGCEYAAFCGGCRAASLMKHGSAFAEDPNCLRDPAPR